MTQALRRFANALLDAVLTADLGLDGVIRVGEDPEDGNARIELYLFDAPTADRRAIETRAIQLLLDTEDRIPGVDSMAFVFTSDLDRGTRADIEARAVVRIAPSSRSPRPGHRV